MNNEFEYITEAFTKTLDNLNLEVDNLNITCLTSKNNSFSLDHEGNLTVKSLNVSEGVRIQEVVDSIYPIGSIYLSVNNVNPSSFFGGTWVSFGTGRTIVGVDSTQGEFNTVEKIGGSKKLQAHEHYSQYLDGTEVGINNGTNSGYGIGISSNNRGTVFVSGREGSGNSQNLQPYITCYMWKKTA